MVRGFGLLLVAGIAFALTCALTLGIAALALRGRGGRPLPGPVRDAGDILAGAARGAGDLLAPLGRRLAGPFRGRRTPDVALRALALRAAARPQRVLAVGAALMALGLLVDTQAEVESDIQRLVPQDLAALQDLNVLQEETGVGGAIDVLVRSDRLTEPETIRWMGEFQTGVLKRYGYDAGRRGCGEADLCPAFSLPDLFRGDAGQSKERIEALLDAVPAYFSQGVVTADRRTATFAFGLKILPLERQQEIVDDIRSRLADAPEGVEAEVAGLPVLAAEANAAVSSPLRRLLTLVAGLVAVLLVLLAAFRSVERAVVPLVPIALASGWAALLLFLTQIPLNPMSVTLSALVIAISTEFSVLLSERYRAERRRGLGQQEALEATYRSTGAAVLASGVTAIAGFAVLVVSDIAMLRNFGVVTVVDLAVSLVGVMVVLPAVLVLAERRAEARRVAGGAAPVPATA
jgi:uncharacterized protein